MADFCTIIAQKISLNNTKVKACKTVKVETNT